ncbi:MAG TPA: cbb3-type cytochrome oxidase assembly protein CcoS [Polyangiaceae bacterium]|nr:cbb3-type cytochrome oxidase assembly protein CcoS [Polyangiaceae bacterium]
MTILFLVLPLTIGISAISVAAFAWATRKGQFDDLETPALRILHDDTPRSTPTRSPSEGA